jgi:hypothetical protein
MTSVLQTNDLLIEGTIAYSFFNKVEPGYNDIGLRDTPFVASDTL